VNREILDEEKRWQETNCKKILENFNDKKCIDYEDDNDQEQHKDGQKLRIITNCEMLRHAPTQNRRWGSFRVEVRSSQIQSTWV
jgi:hypothetical protein